MATTSLDPVATSDEQKGVMNAQEEGGKYMCDDCEQYREQLVDCEACGLCYCTECDAQMHRKGKLRFHTRQNAVMNNQPETDEHDGVLPDDVMSWRQRHVDHWLSVHSLTTFENDFHADYVDGPFLLLGDIESFIESTSRTSRGLRKKLQREIHKIRSQHQTKTKSPVRSASQQLMQRRHTTMHMPRYQNNQVSASERPARRRSVVRQGLSLRVNVDAEPTSTAFRPPFSPVTPESQKKWSDADFAVDNNAENRRRSSSSKAESLSRRRESFRPSLAPLLVESEVSNRADRKKKMELDIDLQQVKKDEHEIAASFDFSDTGRLQTQGFDINPDGITHVPSSKFPKRHGTSPVGTKDCLLMLQELGQGAGGKVYKAMYLPTFQFVAVKVIRIYEQQKRRQMVRELKSLYANFSDLNDPTAHGACTELVEFYDAYTNPSVGSVSIVLELMDGGSLQDRVNDGQRTIDEMEIAQVAYGALKGLSYLHAHHQLHRDIKLSNMLVNHQGQVKISDFGISRDLESTLAKATTFTGTLLYMAPERISGGMYSYPSDIWSFGLAMMAYATGELPVPTKEGYWGVVHAVRELPSPKLSDCAPGFSSDLCDFVDSCLHKNPAMRLTAQQLLEHDFIKKNYHPPDQSDTFPPALDMNKSISELKEIAKKTQMWCQEQLQSSRGEKLKVNFARTCAQEKVAALVKQTRLPTDAVQDMFAFLSAYC